MRYLFPVLIAALGLSGLTAELPAQQWGDLSMQFVYAGGRVEPAPLEITKDKEFCGAFQVVDESLTVDPQTKGIANVMAWLFLGRGEAIPPVHESYLATAEDKILLDNEKCRFAPHALVLRTSQTLVAGNSDAVGHNFKIDTFANRPFNRTIPAGGKFEHKFPLPERLPVRVSCSIHPWMSAYILIRSDPLMAVSDATGRLVIKNVPVGKRTFQFWQEKAGYIDQVTIGGKAAAWARGRLEVDIKPGLNDLGEVRLAPALFEDNLAAPASRSATR